MKKVLLIFLGLVLLFQGFKIWERGHRPASSSGHVPARTHHSHPGHGGVFETRLNLATPAISGGESTANLTAMDHQTPAKGNLTVFSPVQNVVNQTFESHSPVRFL
jgi:hypothetical protein